MELPTDMCRIEVGTAAFYYAETRTGVNPNIVSKASQLSHAAQMRL